MLDCGWSVDPDNCLDAFDTKTIYTGHAIRCSVEMGVHKALGRLASEGHRISKEVAQIFVSAARTWCALFALGKSCFVPNL